ncbi:hypothetical protein D3C83_256520 [compost metagenome]
MSLAYSHACTVNQRLLTNVAVVRLKRGGKRFEIAAYKNKVSSPSRMRDSSLTHSLSRPLGAALS